MLFAGYLFSEKRSFLSMVLLALVAAWMIFFVLLNHLRTDRTKCKMRVPHLATFGVFNNGYACVVFCLINKSASGSSVYCTGKKIFIFFEIYFSYNLKDEMALHNTPLLMLFTFVILASMNFYLRINIT